jgi:hypothetical protein
MESFFATLQSEFFRLNRFTTICAKPTIGDDFHARRRMMKEPEQAGKVCS